jgi:integrase/recombinase XerD
MTALSQIAEEYLELRNSLGHNLAEAHRLLPRFVAYLDSIGASTVTVEAALFWSQQPEAQPGTSVWARRMTIARGFARHMSGIDPRTEVPPVGLVTFRQRWRPPFIFSSSDIEALKAAAEQAIPTPLRAATVSTMIALLAVTGMRVGEVISIDRSSVHWTEGVLVVRASKFDKSREVPVAASTMAALAAYAEVRDQLQPRPRTSAFFVSMARTPVNYCSFGQTFRQLLETTGVGAESSVRPRIHDLRHSFAVHTLVRWYRAGENVGALLPRLSTYLGHRSPISTYWYLSAAPELLALAAGRIEEAGS